MWARRAAAALAITCFVKAWRPAEQPLSWRQPWSVARGRRRARTSPLWPWRAARPRAAAVGEAPRRRARRRWCGRPSSRRTGRATTATTRTSTPRTATHTTRTRSPPPRRALCQFWPPASRQPPLLSAALAASTADGDWQTCAVGDAESLCRLPRAPPTRKHDNKPCAVYTQPCATPRASPAALSRSANLPYSRLGRVFADAQAHAIMAEFGECCCRHACLCDACQTV